MYIVTVTIPPKIKTMKLLYCKNCGDITLIHPEKYITKCVCEKSWARLGRDNRTVTLFGEHAECMGLNNHDFLKGLANKKMNPNSRGLDMRSFFISNDSKYVKREENE